MEFSLTDAEFKTFKDFIYDKSGIFFSEINRAILENRLFEIMLKYQYKSIMDYYEKLKNDPVEVRNFLDLITTNLTKFFRNQPQFEALEKEVLPDIAKRNEFSRTIKI
ncbi:MAG TPA: protein-glutamate O-methyltransferase CheR, partial [Exilispira sp.]|nr:protein-glutamate O-methyltransferase CheR [Exilispira sp.]